MRIGLVLDRFLDPTRGGREQWTFHFVEQLAARGHEIHVISREFGEAIAGLPATLHRVKSEKKSPLAFAEAAPAVIEPLALDIIHDLGTGWYCDVFQPHGGSWASIAHRKSLFLPRWFRWLKQRVDRLLPRFRGLRTLMARQYSDHGQVVLALSRSAAGEFERFHQVAPQRIRIIYNGVDTQRFSPEQCALHREAVRRRLGIDRQSVLALLVAHNFRLKGVPTLLAAMARLTADGQSVRLAIVGGKRLEPWRREARRLGLEDRVIFVGQIDDTVPYYAAADFYVHPTFYDPCSLVVLEAAACGLPIITSRYNGAAELFREDVETCLISDPSDPEELAAAMRSVLDPSVRHRMGMAARKTTLAHSFDRNVDQIIAVYQEIVERRGGLPHDHRVWAARISLTQQETTPATRERRVERVPEQWGAVR